MVENNQLWCSFNVAACKEESSIIFLQQHTHKSQTKLPNQHLATFSLGNQKFNIQPKKHRHFLQISCLNNQANFKTFRQEFIMFILYTPFKTISFQTFFFLSIWANQITDLEVFQIYILSASLFHSFNLLLDSPVSIA